LEWSLRTAIRTEELAIGNLKWAMTLLAVKEGFCLKWPFFNRWCNYSFTCAAAQLPEGI